VPQHHEVHLRSQAGLQAQAVGRVDRIGQTSATTVHRFLVQQSVRVTNSSYRSRVLI